MNKSNLRCLEPIKSFLNVLNIFELNLNEYFMQKVKRIDFYIEIQNVFGLLLEHPVATPTFFTYRGER